MATSGPGRTANGNWLAWGLVLGLTAGAIVALLYAPHSGADFRSWVSRRARSVTGDAKAKIEAAAPVDPLARSMAEGKEAAARRRRETAAF